MANLCGHLKRNGVTLHQSLFFPRVVFLSPECELNEELKKRKELVTYDLIDDFLRSFRESYIAWISDALTPSWISGEHFLQKYLTNISTRKSSDVLNQWIPSSEKDPSLILMFAPAGHFSYRQMESMREVLGKVGTWDLVRLHCGEQLKGDYQGCQYIALNRQETDTLAFSRAKTLSSNSLWALLGHTPQVSPQHWLWWLISRNTPS